MRDVEQGGGRRPLAAKTPVLKASLQQVDPLQFAAMQWFVQLQGNPDDRALHSEFEAWINEGPDHKDAYVAVQHLWDISQEAPEANQAYRRYIRRQFARKAALAGGAGLAVADGSSRFENHQLAKSYR